MQDLLNVSCSGHSGNDKRNDLDQTLFSLERLTSLCVVSAEHTDDVIC